MLSLSSASSDSDTDDDTDDMDEIDGYGEVNGEAAAYPIIHDEDNSNKDNGMHPKLFVQFQCCIYFQFSFVLCGVRVDSYSHALT